MTRKHRAIKALRALRLVLKAFGLTLSSTGASIQIYDKDRNLMWELDNDISGDFVINEKCLGRTYE